MSATLCGTMSVKACCVEHRTLNHIYQLRSGNVDEDYRKSMDRLIKSLERLPTKEHYLIGAVLIVLAFMAALALS